MFPLLAVLADPPNPNTMAASTFESRLLWALGELLYRRLSAPIFTTQEVKALVRLKVVHLHLKKSVGKAC